MLQVITKLDLGGAESVAVDLAGALHEDVDFAIFAVFALDAPSQVGLGMAERLAGWKVPVFTGTSGHFKTGGALVAAWKLARAVRQFRADVVHLHTEVPELTYAIATVLSPRLRRVQVLRTIHNSELWIAWGRVGRWVTERLGASTALAVSQAAAEADAAIPTQRARPRAAIVANGVVAPPLAPARKPGPFRLLFAARFVPAKGSDLLPAILRAARRHSGRPDVEVTIAGTGPQEAALRRELQDLAADWSIEIVPPIEQLGRRLGEWDAVLMPSRFEGLPLLAIEVLMAGVPLVATRVPGLAEVIPRDYPFCAQVDDVEALGLLIARMIANPGDAQAAVAPLRARMVERYSPEAMATSYRQAYLTLAAKAPTRD